jgi:DNA-binding MarR family transcriptional regulator
MKRDVERLMKHLTDLGRMKTLRDPLSRLGGAPGDLTTPQLHAVLWLERDGALPITTLAARIGCTNPSTTGVVDRLEALGYVERKPKPGDRRVHLVELTDAGMDVALPARAAVAESIEGLMSFLTADERKQLVRIFGKLADGLRTVFGQEDAA